MATVTTSRQTTVIFDLGGVLLGQSRAGFITSLGLGTLFTYAVFDRKAPWKLASQLQESIFAVCEHIHTQKDPSFKISYTPSGAALPYVLCAYQAGRITNAQVLEQLPKALDECKKLGYFESNRQEILVNRAIEGIFDAKLIAKYIYPMRPSFQLLREIAHKKNEHGHKKYRILALSNWDRESFTYIKKRFEHQLSYFDEVIISGDIGTIKPNPEMFEYVFSRYDVPPVECVFVDDQLENVQAAEACGIKNAILFTSARELRQKLIELEILP